MKETFADLVNSHHTIYSVLRVCKESYKSVVRMGLYTVLQLYFWGVILFSLTFYFTFWIFYLLDYFFPASLPLGIHLL